ncbi:efflux RND transporter periplasmic adaptor subunit [Petroclostridium sp. X23]|uniref:efflux RND transporter periplasmic adaptor subunit n=1 Tax=Petroclostridium sp. X23 TaxID=3045146 RepID=UPI0024AD3540|nr:efflux RND transporter periplasmic adaptor subunit [Petroclostridium sp. X23]WHH59295.1 efflux RND transporter periplasmic adaptor subunit [Petroclostridium sp. X23]
MKKIFFTLFASMFIVITILLVNYVNIKAVKDVNVYPLEKTGIISSISSNGKIEEVNKAEIYVDIPLKVQNIYVKEGDKVKKDHPLMELDMQSLELELEQAKANLEMEKLNFAKTMKDNYSSFGLEDDKKALYSDKNAVPVFSSEDAIAVYQKKVEIADLKVQELEKKLKQQPDKVISPITGIVTALNVNKGTVASTTQPVITVSDMNNLQIQVDIEEYYVSRIREGQRVEITGEAFEGSSYSGIVEKVSPVAKEVSSGQSTSTVIEIIIDILDEDHLLKPGFSAQVKIITDTKDNTLILPYESIIQDENNNDIVFVIRNNRAYKRKIVTGAELELEIEVVSGLKEGEKVILNPSKEMEDGAKVRIAAVRKR